MITKMADDDWEKTIRDTLCVFGVDDLKPEQKTILRCLIDGKDCMATLPTGYGKSLPYQMLPLLLKKHPVPDRVGKIIICSPLVSLMEDQVSKLRTIPDYSVAFRGSSEDEDELIKSGCVEVIFASPETLVGDKHWRSILQTFEVSTLVVDEFHTVVTWGGLDDKESAFREWFKHLGELRALFPSASLLALSATCPKHLRKKIMKTLQMDVDNTTLISVSPNKPNIKLVMKKVDNTIPMAMLWLVDNLSSLKDKFPRTIIYANSIKHQSDIYKYLCTEVEDCHNFVEMFHSETESEQKKEIISKLQSTNSLRIVIATSALGMGIDIKDCHNVILYGPPTSYIDLIQEMGRVGRDGLPSVAIFMYNSFHLGSCSADLKSLYTSKTCRRLTIMEQFVSKHELKTIEYGTHNCCDICEEACKCGSCEPLPLQNFLSSYTVLEDESDPSSSKTISYVYESDSGIPDSIFDEF